MSKAAAAPGATATKTSGPKINPGGPPRLSASANAASKKVDTSSIYAL